MAPAELDPAQGRPLIEVEVVQCAGRGQLEHHRLSLPEGSVLSDALAACGLQPGPAGSPADDPDATSEGVHAGVGVWGRLARLDRTLVQGDRIEVYRPLQVEPKDARRLRHRRQRTLSAQAKAKLKTGASRPSR